MIHTPRDCPDIGFLCRYEDILTLYHLNIYTNEAHKSNTKADRFINQSVNICLSNYIKLDLHLTSGFQTFAFLIYIRTSHISLPLPPTRGVDGTTSRRR